VAGDPVASDTVVVGEVGLSGEVRGVSYLEARVQEAAALGFARCVVPRVDLERLTSEPSLPLVGVSTVVEALDAVGLGGARSGN
jgi:DNA repair protein RadA/Sms